VEWALDVPLFFLVRGGEYRPASGLTFRQFLHAGLGEERATLADWELHLSTVFPEVRLKRTIEVRGADAGPLDMESGLAALWRGLLDDDQARAAAWALIANHPFAEREALRREVPRLALDAHLGRHRVGDLAVELVRISEAGLRRLPGGAGDLPLLDRLREYAAAGRCPADDLLADYQATGGDPVELTRRWELRGSYPSGPRVASAAPAPGRA
jgi:glutamate--cysteine ligase